MSEQAAPQSLADRARRLAALARAKSETAASTADQARLSDQVRKLTAELAVLKTALDVRARLENLGVQVPTTADLRREPTLLRQEVDTIGRPTWQKIQARTKSVIRTHSDITEADTAAWREWASNRVSSLPQTLIPRLGFARGATEERVRRLRSLAASAPSLGTLAEFGTLVRRVEDDLAQVEGSGIDVVLKRFVQRRILLADLTDEDLALLRAEGSLRDQLYVSLA
ncbi:MAG TPA: hypothetical protein VGK17_16785 [Propionicimonas sp.]|jgi:hypothetical protein